MSGVKTVLVISPHPDDLEIGMGGTVARLVAAGTRVISAVLTDGRRSPRSFTCSDDEMAVLRKREVEAAAEVLGLAQLELFGLWDLRTDENRLRLRAALHRLLGQCRPQEVYLPHPELDRHESHRISARLCLDIIADSKIDTDRWAYEVWGLFPSWQRVEDITEFVEQKAAAIECHRSQVTDVAYSEGVLGLNRWRAVFTDPHSIPGARYLEAFIKL